MDNLLIGIKLSLLTKSDQSCGIFVKYLNVHLNLREVAKPPEW